MIWITLGILLIIGVVALQILRSRHNAQLEQRKLAALKKGHSEDEINAALAEISFMFPGWTTTLMVVCALGFFGAGLWSKIMFYAQPGYIYHVRTIFNEEKKVIKTGWETYWFGYITAWKQDMTAQWDEKADEIMQTMGETVSASSSSKPLRITFLDQVDGYVEFTVRWSMPTDNESFFKIAHKYRTPENLLRTGLIPAAKETMNATASLMSAEEYFAGGRTEFQNEFEAQMTDGIYVVKRNEITVTDNTSRQRASANATKGEDQDDFEDNTKTIFVVEKILDDKGQPKRKTQKFFDNFSITVVDARVTDLDPNKKFKDRMEQKQEASAKRAIAREQRIQEEEQRQLAVAKGQREQAEAQAAQLVDQIKRTTEAETQKQLAVTKANQLKEKAKIEKETSSILLDKAKIDAQAVKVAADAEAHARKVKLQSDNLVERKLQALETMNKDIAVALSKRQVPTTVIYQGGTGEGSLGTDNDIRSIAQTQMIKNLKALDLDMTVKQ